MKETKSKIRLYGDTTLRKRAKPVKTVTAAEKKIFEKMLETMREEGGIGLAAPQIGISKQLLVVEVGNEVFMIANPKITKMTGCDSLEEGCLSFPEVAIKIKRPKKISLTCLNENNCAIEIEADDIIARAIQHEMDHLKGKLIVDYASLADKIRLKKKLDVIKKKSKQGR
ncbi:peptide deformylase [Candidatus Omnitrophota bacterium]